MEADVYARIMLLYEKRPIIETLKNADKHKKILDSILMDRLKIEGEVEDENEEEVVAHVVRGHKVLKEIEDPGCFVLPIRLEGDLTYYSLVDTRSNINMMPYKIYELLERGKVKPKIDNKNKRNMNLMF
jgi:hypothetical protein